MDPRYKNPRMIVSIPTQLLGKVDDHRAASGHTRSVIVQLALEDWFSRKERRDLRHRREAGLGQ